MNNDKIKIAMILYGNLLTDARVKRSAQTLSSDYSVDIYSLYETDTKGEYFNIGVFKKIRIYGIFTYALFIIKCTLRLFFSDYKIIYGHDIFSVIPIYFVSIFKNKNIYIYDSHELYVPQKNNSIKNSIFLFFQKKYIKKCSLIITASEERAQLMQNEYKLSQVPITIRNVSILPKTDIHVTDPVLEKYEFFFRIPAFAIVYAGVIVKGRKLDALIDVVNKLGRDFKLFLLGNGDAYKELSDKIFNINNNNIQIEKAVPYEKLGNILCKFDVGYMYYGTDTLNNIFCAPNKIFEYASVNLPILSNYNPTIYKILNEYSIGISSDDIFSSLNELKHNVLKYKRNLQSFIDDNSWENEEKKLQQAIKHLFLKEG